MKRFTITRTVVSGAGINAEIELSAADATAAEAQAAALFSHEVGAIAVYLVTVKKGSR